MRWAPTSGPRVARSVALAAAAGALVLSVAGPGALLGPLGLVVAAAALVPFVLWSAPPASLARVLPRAAALVLFTTALVAWLSRSLGTLVVEPSLFARSAGPVLLAAAFVFTLAPRAFSVGRAQLPAIIGVLCVAGLDPAPEGYAPAMLPFLRAGEHNGFGDNYLALALVVLVALWTAELLESGPRWSRRGLATLGLSLAGAAFLAASGIAGLPSLQPHVERAVASTFTEAGTGLSGESRLGEFAELAVSRGRVLDLQTSLPAGGAWLLPSEVLTRFDGREWRAPAPPGRDAAQPDVLRPTAPPPGVGPLLDGLGSWFEADAPATGGAVELRVTQAEVQSWPLLLPRGTRHVTAGAWLLQRDAHGLLRRPDGHALRLYGAVWSAETAAAGARAALLPADRAESLTLPPRVDPRLAALASELGPPGRTDRERADATLRHLRTGYRYTLAPGAFRTDDPLAEFLFDKRAAYCEYFASAAVVLLRLQGVPARYVKGLSAGPHTDQGGGLHVVRESAAHAWIEAWIEGEGWVELDPTPPADFAAVHPPASAAARLAERLRAWLATAWRRLVDLGPLALLRALWADLGRALRLAASSLVAWVALALLLVGRPLWRFARTRQRLWARPAVEAPEAAVPADLRALVRELERRWASAGVPRPPARGLLEHADRLAATGRGGATGQSIAAAYYRARFGGESPRTSDVEAMRQALRGATTHS